MPKEFLPLFVESSRPDGYWVISKLFLRYFKDIEKPLFLSALISKYHLFKTKGFKNLNLHRSNQEEYYG